MTAQNLIEILEASAHNANVSLDELEVKVADPAHYQWNIDGYDIEFNQIYNEVTDDYYYNYDSSYLVLRTA